MELDNGSSKIQKILSPVVATLVVVAVVVCAALVSRTNRTIESGETPAYVWSCLLDTGYRGDPTDRAERLTVKVTDLNRCTDLPVPFDTTPRT